MRLTTDRAEIMAVLGHPDIWPCVAPESVAPDDFEPPLHDHYYLVAGDQPEALVIHHWVDGDTLKTHHQVLPQHRERAMEHSLSALAWAFDNTAVERIICSIPHRFPNVLAHAKKAGFTVTHDDGEQHWLKLERSQWAS